MIDFNNPQLAQSHYIFQMLFIAWLIILGITFVDFWRNRKQRSGIVLAYMMLLFLVYGILGFVFAVPYYDTILDRQTVLIGYWYATIGAACVMVGAIWVYPILRRLHYHTTNKQAEIEIATPQNDELDRQQTTLPYWLLSIGLFCDFLLSRLLGGIPSIGAFVTQLAALSYVGIILVYAREIRKTPPNKRLLGGMIALTVALALKILLLDGFLWFGTLPLMVFFAFLLRYSQQFTRTLVMGLVITYLGLSVYVTYIADRNELRNVIWSDANLNTRVDTVYGSLFQRFRLFTFSTNDFNLIEYRLGLTYLTGAGIKYQELTGNDFVQGETFFYAAQMLVPRVLWTDKPVLLGGSALVTRFTGIEYYGNTSVGLGLFLEYYVNFGLAGVIFGSLTMGCILRLFSNKIAFYINRGMYIDAAFWLLPSYGLLIPEDNFIAIVGKVGSGFITMWVVKTAFNSFYLSERFQYKLDKASESGEELRLG